MKTQIKLDWRSRLAGRALCNVYLGGASALTIAKKMDTMNLPGAYEAMQVVDYVYHHDDTKPYTIAKCEWCGQEFMPCDTENESLKICSLSCAESFNS